MPAFRRLGVSISPQHCKNDAQRGIELRKRQHERKNEEIRRGVAPDGGFAAEPFREPSADEHAQQAEQPGDAERGGKPVPDDAARVPIASAADAVRDLHEKPAETA